MDFLKNKPIILRKIVDKQFQGDHPNGINVGYELRGYNKDGFVIGESVLLYRDLNHTTPSSWTSKLEKIDEEKMELHTKYSVYKVELID